MIQYLKSHNLVIFYFSIKQALEEEKEAAKKKQIAEANAKKQKEAAERKKQEEIEKVNKKKVI